MKHLKLGAQDMLDASQRKKREELKEARAKEEEARQSMLLPFPDEVRLWTVDDVGRWLDTLTLSQYIQDTIISLLLFILSLFLPSFLFPAN